MALFQTSVLKSHLALLNEAAVDKAYKKYQKYFWNTAIQENIKSAKEEQYQAIFLNELFVNILGYTLFPNPNSNLTTEFKNEKNARKADGAILKDGNAIGVIELKGTNTKDLESIRRQAFDYKANQRGCVYVITSNFEKLRFYINDATEFEEFDLFTLLQDRFKLLYLCLHIDSILNNTSLKIKEASIVVEEEITKAFYKDYSIFKRELYRDLVKRNAKTVRIRLGAIEGIENQEDIARLEKNVKLTLFKKSQKLIDRFLFVFFAEDRMLLPSNSTLQILNKWKDDWDFGDERPLYNLFKQYFNFLDIGRRGTEKRAEIYAYNGGLFKPDTILDALEIDNDLLYKYTTKLSIYDFESQVDVNILGHIFENSLNEIESVNAEIEGDNFDKQTSKRKKDGVFYTPKYITKYIVENTVGKLCEEKKIELDFHEEEYFKGRKNRNKTTIERLVKILDEYRDWLLQLTICDPACGSGAFLNQALDFLIKEHTYIDELKTKILGGGLQFPDIENTILENNIYGVDLNEESVEIAKLSLWLRTAQPRRKLNDLSSNIKCGNSLIDDKKVAGDKAFKWENEFPDVFADGGFDVVIGNPPYVRPRSLNFIQQEWLIKNFICAENQFDLYHLFIEQAENIKKPDGIVSYILPNAFLANENSKKLRKYILDFCTISTIIECGSKVFPDASVEVLIYIFYSKAEVAQFGFLENTQFVRSNYFNPKLFYDNFNINFTVTLSEIGMKLHQKIKKASLKLGDLTDVMGGIKEYQVGKGKPPQTKEDRELSRFNSTYKTNETYVKEVRGKHVNPYYLDWNEEYISYGPWLAEPRNPEFFKGTRLFMRQIPGRNRLYACYTNEDFVVDQSAYIIKPQKESEFEIKSILPLINSKLIFWYYRNENNEFDQLFPKIKSKEIKNLPIHIDFKSVEDKMLDRANILNNLNDNLFQSLKDFIKFLIHTHILNGLSKKLQNWHELPFSDFIKELNKAIKATNKLRAVEDLSLVPELTKKDEFEWMELFEENKKKAQELQTQIATTEKEIDKMVYELYGLTEEEIRIVEKSN
ncbi:N-6 DNA methylase [Arenibacter algicola]|uniref:Eco57I restriction-modification methylase domain-containing protein n=1 Tax=Arenibacter algicola TaxID=616991 RepID=UPI001C06E3A1|nr:N-6 DNA methylase [Arenibacter algicola]MBU2907573.1 N-6 DNA methylase [Arenibacter algicola]